MKKFDQFKVDMMESFYNFTNAAGGVPMDGITDKNGIIDRHQVWKAGELRRVNAYIGAILRGQTANPNDMLVDLRMRLQSIGIDFEPFVIDDQNGQFAVQCSQYRGMGWNSKTGEVEEFENFNGMNLYLILDYWTNMQGYVQMNGKLVGDDQIEYYVDEEDLEGISEACKLKEEDGMCPECGKEECECGESGEESDDEEDDGEEELEEGLGKLNRRKPTSVQYSGGWAAALEDKKFGIVWDSYEDGGGKLYKSEKEAIAAAKNAPLVESMGKLEEANAEASVISKEVKAAMKKMGIAAKVRTIPSKKDNPWIEVFARDPSGNPATISNDIRIKALQAMGIDPESKSVLNKDDINYGNVGRNSIAMTTNQWKKFLLGESNSQSAEELEESRTFSSAEEMGYRERYERPKPPSFATTTAKGIFLHYGVANRLKSDETYKDWFKAFKELPVYEKDALISAMYSAKDEMKDWDKVEDFVNSYPRLKKAIADRNETEFDKRKKRLGESNSQSAEDLDEASNNSDWLTGDGKPLNSRVEVSPVDAYRFKYGKHHIGSLTFGSVSYGRALIIDSNIEYDKKWSGANIVARIENPLTTMSSERDVMSPAPEGKQPGRYLTNASIVKLNLNTGTYALMGDDEKWEKPVKFKKLVIQNIELAKELGWIKDIALEESKKPKDLVRRGNKVRMINPDGEDEWVHDNDYWEALDNGYLPSTPAGAAAYEDDKKSKVSSKVAAMMGYE